MAAFFIAQMVLVVTAIAGFFLWVWSVATDPTARVGNLDGVDFFDEGEQGIITSSWKPIVFFALFAASLWVLYQTQFDLCSLLRFWWPDMPPDVFGWSCVILPKMQ